MNLTPLSSELSFTALLSLSALHCTISLKLNFKMLLNLPIQLLALASCALAAPHSLISRAVINHDAVVGFPQTVPSGITGTLYLKYKPYLKIFNGCVPFPAVDAAGNTG
ncbi:hypothetical protein NX059_010595 [Plenodomus lindquistii]|nr:hypothetical protein NX059_010595 [Plenodomus lindquistii]